MLKKMNEKEMRNANGGSYCKVCGYSNWNEWKVMRHIASRHPAVVLRTMWNLATSQANANDLKLKFTFFLSVLFSVCLEAFLLFTSILNQKYASNSNDI